MLGVTTDTVEDDANETVLVNVTVGGVLMKSVLVLWFQPKVHIATAFAKVEQNICLTGKSDTVVIGSKPNSCLALLLLCGKAINPQPCHGLILLKAMKSSNHDLLDLTQNPFLWVLIKCLVAKTTVSFNLVKKCCINL